MTSIRSSRVVLPDGIRPATIHLSNGLIAAISDQSAEHDYGDLVVLPGLVDSHVHLNEPGRTEWEGFETGTRAAAAGGTTTIVDMPLNSIPPTTSVEALEVKRTSARGKLAVDVAFWGGLVPGSEGHLRGLVGEGVCGFKAFMVDSGVDEFPPMESGAISDVLPLLRKLDVPLLLHAEDPAELRSLHGDGREYDTYLLSRPETSEDTAVAQAAEWSDSGGRVHILHVSSGSSVATIARRPKLSGETCPHYLLFCSEDVPSGATAFKCAPPIRSAEHREALWAGLADGSLSMVVSDHSPAPVELKAIATGDFGNAWGGVGSLQLRLQATWTGASQRGFEIEHLARWLALGPARLAGLDERKGSIEVGKDADFVVFDPDGSVRVRGTELEHRHPLTPYDGMTLRGSVRSTILAGTTIFDGGNFVTPNGRMLRRNG